MKIVKVTMALALVFALVVPAVMADDICVPCTKCPPLDMGCPSGDQWGGVSCVYGDDYHMTWQTPGVLPMPYSRPLVPYDGTMGASLLNAPGIYPECPVIFNICACPDTSQFVPTAEVSVRMKLLVNGQEGDNGAYWNELYTGDVVMSCDYDFLCTPTCGALIRTTPVEADGSFAYYCDANGNLNLDAAESPYRMVTASPTLVSYYYWSGTRYENTLPAFALDCVRTGYGERVVMVAAESLVVIQQIDEEEGMCMWAMDVPSIVVTPAITECSTISAQIELTTDVGGDICSDTTIECFCVYDLYTVCCERETRGLTYPYFTSIGGDDIYWNGIAITNLSSTAGVATLTVHEQDGDTFTYTTPTIGPYSMFANLLELIPFAGAGTAGDSRCWIDVMTDFNADGLGFFAERQDPGRSMGYLPRLMSPSSASTGP